MPSAASSPRFHCPGPLASGQRLALPPLAARHVQVLRLQPGQPLTLFNGAGGEFDAVVERMGRDAVEVRVGAHSPIEREPGCAVHLAVGMAASDRMDWLVEKATELGAASLQPLAAQRSVLKLAGERALKKQQHWQAIAVAACEQCGRNRVPLVHPVRALPDWLAAGAPAGMRLLLSPGPDTVAWTQPDGGSACVLSGPEGGLTPHEEALARQHGFVAASLGPRVLRAETAPLAALVLLALGA